MARRIGLVLAGLSVVALSLSGCYTVLRSPYAADVEKEPRYAGWDDQRRHETPTLGRFDNGDRPADPYGLGYGGQGFPIFGYNSQYGGFGSGFGPYGGGGYGSPYGYSSGYGPHGYGYDPYYQNAQGVYVPPGYELVTTTELDRLRSGERVLNTTNSSGFVPIINRDEVRRKEIERDQEMWQRRSTPRTVRSAPITRRPTTTAAPAPTSSAKPAAAKSAETKKTKTKSSGDSKAKSRRKRR